MYSPDVTHYHFDEQTVESYLGKSPTQQVFNNSSDWSGQSAGLSAFPNSLVPSQTLSRSMQGPSYLLQRNSLSAHTISGQYSAVYFPPKGQHKDNVSSDPSAQSGPQVTSIPRLKSPSQR